MTSWTKRRTYDKATFEAARAAWDAGDFSDEWRPWRHLAAMEAGIIFPPDGTKFDSWGDDSPSQRAMLVRMMREQPDALRVAIKRARRASWSSVIEDVLGVRDRLSEEAERDQRDDERIRAGEPTQRQAARTLRDILDLIGGS